MRMLIARLSRRRSYLSPAYIAWVASLDAAPRTFS